MIPRPLLAICAALGLALGTAHADPTSITATLDADRIPAGEAAELSVSISGTTAAEPVLPQVDGLDFQAAGTSSNFQFVNGTISRSVTYVYRVIPSRAGLFTIPAITVGKLSSAPLTLTVGTGGGSAPAANPGPGGGTPPPPVSPPADGTLAFIRISLPKKEFYVGEVMPLEVRAYFRTGVQASLDSAPTLRSDAFTLLPINGKPRRDVETIDGQEYEVLAWPTALAAVKAGDASLGLEMPALLLVRQRVQRPPGFNNPMFDDFFGTVAQKRVTLRNDTPKVKVLPLPADGRPADFSGAVGDFTLEADVSPRQAGEGDPLSLRARIAGRGNFDRVTTTLLPSTLEWKTYPPSVRFDNQDGLATQGAKTFEQAIIPSGTGARQVPSVAFSYFDPDAKKYVTRTTAPLDVAISPAPAGQTPVPSPLPAAPSATAAATPPASDLAPNKAESGRFAATLRPLCLDPRFLALQGVPVAALLASLAVIVRRRRRAGDLRARRREAARRAAALHLRAADEAAARGDAPAFLAAARAALREHLGGRWDLPPETITLAEIEDRTPSDSPIRLLFRRADEAAFSGGTLDETDLGAWRQTLRAELKGEA